MPESNKYEPSEIDKAYAAGLVDGEGCIFIDCLRRTCVSSDGCKRYPGARRYSYGVRVRMCDPEGIVFLASVFGGKVKPVNPPSFRKRGYKPQFRWEFCQRKAEKFLKLIYPYLKVKTKEAGILLELASLIGRGPTGRGYKLSDADKSKRDVLVFKIRNSGSGKRKFEELKEAANGC